MAIGIQINPKQIKGAWDQGFALDVHTTGSTFAGYNAYGHATYDTTRSPIGELVFRLKYRFADPTVSSAIVETVVEFLKQWSIKIDKIVPMPPSVASRAKQPVIELARGISAGVGVPLCERCIAKIKKTPQLKDIRDYTEKKKLLSDAFYVNSSETKGMRLLVFDDLYDTGASMDVLVQHLKTNGQASQVYVLALTYTRN